MLERLIINRYTFFIVLFLADILFGQVNESSQEKCSIVLDEKSGEPMLIGLVSEKNFADTSFNTPFSKWYMSEYKSYDLDSLQIDSLKNEIDNETRAVIVFGTWCSDSRREFPRFMKILNNIGFNKGNLKLICVDRNKKSDDIDISVYEIKLIPTFILYHKELEIGRIIETPQISLEKDLLKILSNVKTKIN